jgi:hypothetical protein
MTRAQARLCAASATYEGLAPRGGAASWAVRRTLNQMAAAMIVTITTSEM